MLSDRVPATLAEAHEVLTHRRPRLDADPRLWIDFHRHGAEVYARTARTDERHRHEATQWAATELRRAREIERHLDPHTDQESCVDRREPWGGDEG
ncbi:MAG: AMED_5909 family protein [Actinophytocola sp.]|uniref:AMED_5909 family protein n=1 Tax=Actinophytocola sp. TaxID=1872138 RepID=UPI003C72B49C